MPRADFKLILIFSQNEMRVKYLFHWAGSNRFTFLRNLMLTPISMETELTEASCMQCLGLSRAEFGSHIPHNLNWLYTANVQCQSPPYVSAFLWGLGTLHEKHSHRLTPLPPTGSAAPVLAAAPASARLLINGFIFSGSGIERCWATFYPFCSASALAGRAGRGRMQWQGGVSAFSAAIQHNGPGHKAQISSTVRAAFQHNRFCEQRMPVLCIWCSLYFAGFFRCRTLNHPVGSCLEICYFKRKQEKNIWILESWCV